MRLTWRDAVTSVLVGAAVVVYAMWTTGIAMTSVSTTVIGVIVFASGWAACVTNQREMAIVYGVDRTKARTTTMYAVATSVLGAVALMAGIAAIFRRSERFVVVLLGALVAMWLAATARHAFGWWMKSADEPEVGLDRAA